MDQEPDPLFKVFATQLERLRTAKGWSQDALDKRIGFPGEMVSRVESGRSKPTAAFAAALDAEAFPDTGGLFTELLGKAERSPFQRWVDAEQRASVIRWWQPLSVPGLLQTEAYIRVVLDAWRAVDGIAETDAEVAARLERQAILDSETPPSLGVVLDETVLRRCVGGPKVMHEQLLHLAEMSERPRVTVQVVPSDVGAHVGLMGAFAIASFAEDSPAMAYLESPDAGTTTRNPTRVGRIAVAYDTLKSDALSARASRDLFRKVAEETWAE